MVPEEIIQRFNVTIAAMGLSGFLDYTVEARMHCATGRRASRSRVLHVWAH